MQQAGLSTAVIRLTRALDEDGIAYAIGGAIALGYYTPPRATADIDIGIGVDSDQLPHLFQLLEKAGCVFDPQAALEGAQRGDFGVTLSEYRVDVFLPIYVLAEEALRSRIRVPFGDDQIWIVSLEALVMLKLLYSRTKDFADLERLVALNRSALDQARCIERSSSLFGPDDARTRLLRGYLR
ncbi:MAG: hypothetical protein AAFQ65_15380 [Myxococcota bacterium]